MQEDPDLPVELFRSGHSSQHPTQWKLPFVTPKRRGRLSGRFEVAPAIGISFGEVRTRPPATARRFGRGAVGRAASLRLLPTRAIRPERPFKSRRPNGGGALADSTGGCNGLVKSFSRRRSIWPLPRLAAAPRQLGTIFGSSAGSNDRFRPHCPATPTLRSQSTEDLGLQASISRSASCPAARIHSTGIIRCWYGVPDHIT